MPLFRWLSFQPIPEHCDLRRCGWDLLPTDVDAETHAPCPILADIGMIAAPQWIRLLSKGAGEWRAHVILIGVNRAEERARLLRLGFGDAMAAAPAIAELEARAEMVALRSTVLPRQRRVGPLHLDLLRRDALINGRALHLHPREFAVLWRLADTVNQPVSRHTLLQEVWQLQHMPETNSLAVHICRLRAKLALGDCADMIVTTRDGAYILAWPQTRNDHAFWLRAPSHPAACHETFS